MRISSNLYDELIEITHKDYDAYPKKDEMEIIIGSENFEEIIYDLVQIIKEFKNVRNNDKN